MKDSHETPDPADPVGPASFSARLKAKYGAGVDPEVSLDAPGAPGSESFAPATSELVRRLAQQTLKESRYALEGEIARGGMGAILRIWDGDLRRHLAMKVILGDGESASGGTPHVEPRQLARFLEEAQVTGQLDHPGIVPVHELGLDREGRVYFTMKLVKGRDLKAIFDLAFAGAEGWNETRALGVILKACEAMAYAHAKGVIHRDLKPANVMVGNFGEVYVMDWGLARVLGKQDSHDIRLRPETADTPAAVETARRDERESIVDSPLVTMDGDVLGTPTYMPPEQARGEIDRLTPRSDVYALGAMLYHLLARRPPFQPAGQRRSPLEIVSAIHAGPPERLHELRADVPGELAAIVEKAMAREPSARYADTLELAEDLRAFLEHRVVGAYETGAWAETKKWVQRNKPLAASLAAAVVLLVAGLSASLVFKARAEESARIATLNEVAATQREAEAKAAEQRATKVTEFVQAALVSADPNQGGEQDYLVRDAMDKAMKDLDGGALKEDSETEASLRTTIARILDGNGRSADALRLAEQALATRQRLHAGDHPDVATSLNDVALYLDSLGRGAEALPKHEACLAMHQRLFPGDHEDVALSHNNVGSCLQSLGRSAEALPMFEAALEMRQRLGQGDDPQVASNMSNLAVCFVDLGRGAEALPKFEAALEMLQRLFPGDHPDLATGLGNLGFCLSTLGRGADALAKFEAALEMNQRLFQGDHPLVARNLINCASCLGSLGRSAEALPKYEAALEMCQRLFPGDHRDVALSLNGVAYCLQSLGRTEEALPKYEAALQMRRRVFQGDHPEICGSLNNFAFCLQALGRGAEALPQFEAALEMYQRLYSGDHPDVASSLNNLAGCLHSLGRSEEALPHAERASAMAERVLPEGHARRAACEKVLASIRGAVGG